MAIMQNLGFTSSKSEEVKGMVSSLAELCWTWQEDAPQEKNRAKQIAVTIDGKVVVVYGAGILSDVARRWKTQINENGKAWAFFEILPELNHNAVLGYRNPVWAMDKITVIFLICPSINLRTQLRYKFTGELLTQNKIAYQVLNSGGTDPLTQVMSLVLLGDWVSYYLAILNGIDPSPVPEIDLLKKRLAESQ
jgi:glucose/mannose-6-phosphate isomerase